MRHLFHIDVARCIAILLVTGFHLWRFFGGASQPISPHFVNNILSHGYIGVDLFFVVSGFAMMLTWERLNGSWRARALEFFKARALRILPAYLIAICFWVLFIRTTGAAWKPTGFLDIISHVLLLHTLSETTFFTISGVMWSLGVEFHFYILFPILVVMPRIGRVAILAVSAVYVILVMSFGDSANHVARWNVFSFLPLFVLGMELRSAGERFAQPKWFVSALVGATLMSSMSAFGETNMYCRIIVGALLGFAFVGASPFRRAGGSAARAIGIIAAASYSVYLYNYIFLATASPLILGPLGAAIYVCAIFGFGVVMWFVIDRPCEALRHTIGRASPRRVEAQAP